jgi:hypothetical protein
MSQYKILSHFNPDKLEQLVESYLLNGWKLAGGVFFVTRRNLYRAGEFCQSVFKDNVLAHTNNTCTNNEEKMSLACDTVTADSKQSL